MLLKTIIEHILIQNGQHLVDPTKVELNPEKFRILAYPVLAQMSRHDPIVRKFNKTITSRDLEFTESDPLGIPHWISKVVPITSFNTLSPNFIPRATHQLHHSRELIDKSNFFFDYRSPTLFLPYEGTFDITACYRHVIEGDNPDNYEIKSVDVHSITFFNLMSAKFLRSLGLSRRAFSLEPIEITTDAADLVSEAQEMEQAAIESLKDNQSIEILWG